MSITEPRGLLSLKLSLRFTLPPGLVVLFLSPKTLIYDDILYEGGKCDDDSDFHASRYGDDPPGNSSNTHSCTDCLMVGISRVALGRYRFV